MQVIFLHTVAILNWCANKTILQPYKTVIARAKPVAIHAAVKRANGLLRFTRNDGRFYLRLSAFIGG